MAFLKYARASVTKPFVTKDAWDEVRSKALTSSFSRRKSSSVLHSFDPSQYMLSHCTIVASVDTEDGPGPTGKHMVDGFQIDRRFPDYYITPETSRFVNNNGDSWSRKTLLASFHSFIGAENYCEHLQIPELSKGKIVDAAARDVGDSIYIDILVATDRKHKPLIEAVESEQLNTLSMGCFLPGTPVTLADGRRIPIEEVQPGEMVLTHKGRAREVTNKQIRHGRWGMRRIKVVGLPDSVGVTDTHEFYVLRPARVCACGCGEKLTTTDRNSTRRMTKRFKVGHDKRIFNPNGTYSLEEAQRRRQKMTDLKAVQVEKVRADELQVGDYVCFPKLVEAPGERETEGRARLLGYFLAEGSFLKHKGQPVEVQFNFSSEERHTFAQEVVDLLAAEFPEANPAWIQDRSERGTTVVHVTGQDMVRWFLYHGGEYSHRKCLSQEAMWWPVETQRHLLGAWINGDGTRHGSGTTVGTTTSYDLICQLQVISVRCGIPVRLECLFGGKTATISEAVIGGEARRHEVTGKLASFNLCFSRSFSSRLTAVCDKAPTPTHKGRNFRDFDDMGVFPIKSVEPFEYEGWVHDMEVDEDHSYTVHGLAVSNCQVTHTQCSKCGNVAEDETQLCRHIRFHKQNKFTDSLGKQRIVAELCGHWSEPGSVKFIEASWVANPAFTGAVLRNILTPDQAAALGNRVQVAFSQAPRRADPRMMSRAAHRIPKMGFDFGEEGDGGEEPAAPAAKEDDPMEKAVNEMAEYIREKAVEKVRKDMSEDETPRADLNESLNETLIKEAVTRNPHWRQLAKVVLARTQNPAIARRVVLGLLLYRRGGWKAVQAATLNGTDILALSRFLDLFNKTPKIAGEARIYRTVVAVGGMSAYGNEQSYLAACRRVLGREMTGTEKDALLAKGRLYDLGT